MCRALTASCLLASACTALPFSQNSGPAHQVKRGMTRTAWPARAPQPSAALTLSQPVHHLADFPAREPMLVEHPNGTLFVAGYAAPVPTLWRSSDDGKTWTPVNVGTEADGAIGNSDVDLAVAPDGTLYFVAMTYDRKKFEGVGIAMGVSRDMGKTWAWTELSKTRFDDRPWVEVAPDGTAHVIWNDGDGVAYARSRDGGRTWQEQPRIHNEGGSSHLAIGPSGEIAARITPVSASANKHHPGVDLIAVSPDGGATWTKRPSPGKREWKWPPSFDAPVPRWVEPIAWDASGSLYSLWSDPSGLWLARSTDRGKGWTTWKIAEAGEVRYFPYLVGGSAGELAATWFSGRGAEVKVHVARITQSRNAAPRVAMAPPFHPDSWRFGQKPGEPRLRDTAGEYVPVAFLRGNRFAIVTTIQDDQAKRHGFSFRTVAGPAVISK